MKSNLPGTGFCDSFLMKPERNNGVLDLIVAALLALTPFLQHYKGVVKNLAVTVLLVCVIGIAVRLLQFKWQWKSLLPVLPLLVFEVFKIFTTGISVTSVGRAGLVILALVGLATGCVNKRFLLLTGFVVSALATLVLIVQNVLFYGFGIHLTCVPTDWLLDSAKVWELLAKTGLYSVRGTPTGLYRPSAFFLEPSHFFLYTFPILLILLLSKGKDIRKLVAAAFLSVGLLLSTSGMGVALVFGVWAFRICFYAPEEDEYHFRTPFASWKTFFIRALLVIALAVLMLVFPSVRDSVLRIFIPDEAGTTAISGRSSSWEVLKDMTLSRCWFGFMNAADVEEETASFNGFVLTLALHGVIGVALSYVFYVVSSVVLKRQYRFIAITLLVLSFFTVHTHGTFFMLYYAAVLLQGYDEQVLSASA